MSRRPFRLAGRLIVLPALLSFAACQAEGPEGEIEEGVESEEAMQTEEGMQREETPGQATGTPRAHDSLLSAAEDRRAERRTAERREVPRGTRVTLRLNERVSTESADAGDPVTAGVVQAVRDESGEVLIPEGAEAVGQVVASERSGGENDQAVLGIQFDSLQIHGETYPLSATVREAAPETTEGDTGAETAAKIAIGTAAGALIGQVIGGDTEATVAGGAAGAVAGTAIALTSREGEATLEEGSRIVLQLDDPIPLRQSESR